MLSLEMGKDSRPASDAHGHLDAYTLLLLQLGFLSASLMQNQKTLRRHPPAYCRYNHFRAASNQHCCTNHNGRASNHHSSACNNNGSPCDLHSSSSNHHRRTHHHRGTSNHNSCPNHAPTNSPDYPPCHHTRDCWAIQHQCCQQVRPAS